MTEKTMATGGAVLFWSIGEASDVLELRQAFQDAGYAQHAPEYRKANTVAGEALAGVVGGPLTSITPLKDRRGFFVAAITRGAEKNTFADWFSVDLGSLRNADAVDVPREKLRFLPHGLGPIVPGIHSDSQDDARRVAWGEIEGRILAKFEALARIATTGQVGPALVDVLDAMGGTRLRPSGGLYWLKDGADLDRFAELARKVESAACLGSKSSVYIIRHAMDLDALRAVRDAINAEIARDAAEIQDQVTSGKLGVEGCATQEKKGAALALKVSEYETILGEALPALAALADQARTAAAMAKLQAAATAQRGRHAA